MMVVEPVFVKWHFAGSAKKQLTEFLLLVVMQLAFTPLLHITQILQVGMHGLALQQVAQRQDDMFMQEGHRLYTIVL